ncbi:MAG TPA: tetratricopeptide repeat protein, partial [Verrucomicrobiae bacterium]|nr:tetratricopeptide repeat protein [Verrucomicrobiae bacterium]
MTVSANRFGGILLSILLGGMLLAGCERRADRAAIAFQRGCDRYEHGDWDGAIAEFTRTLELDPKLVRAYDYRGCAQSQ